MSYKEGIERLEAIKKYLEQAGAADVETLAALYFPSLHRARVVLANWAKQKELARKRLEQYVYYLPKYPGPIREAAARSRARVMFARSPIPNGWTVKENGQTYQVKNQWTCQAYVVRPLYQLEDRYRARPGELLFTVGWESPDFPTVENWTQIIKAL